MTDAMMGAITEQFEEPVSETGVTEEQVAAYLRGQVNFFERNLDVLAELAIPHESGTVSLIERQVGALREENSQLKNQLGDLINNARGNDALLDKMKVLTLDLLQVEGLEALRTTVQERLEQDFGSDLCRLLIIGDDANDDISAIKSKNDLKRLLEHNRPYCGLLKEEETILLFTDEAAEIGSAAILPLYSGEQLLGVLAIGSGDKDHYRQSMSTALLAYLSEIVSKVIAQNQ